MRPWLSALTRRTLPAFFAALALLTLVTFFSLLAALALFATFAGLTFLANVTLLTTVSRLALFSSLSCVSLLAFLARKTALALISLISWKTALAGLALLAIFSVLDQGDLVLELLDYFVELLVALGVSALQASDGLYEDRLTLALSAQQVRQCRLNAQIDLSLDPRCDGLELFG